MNYQSDFRIVFSFPENKLPQYPWRLELSTPNTPGYNVFVAWFDGENYHNCKPQEDGTLLVPVDNHDLAPGVLTYKINIDDADADFPDRFMNVTIPGTLAVELWAGPSDEFAGEIGVVVLPVKGDPGPGVASGGKTGQMLAKQSDADYDTVWVDPTSAPTINVVQTPGQSEADVMSQKAVTDALDKKVDAEEGKGLSSNDYTNLDKNKVASAVLFSPQTLTDEQKEQARANIGMGYPMRQIIDLYPLVGYNCYAVYRFDDSGYYVLCRYHIIKLSLTLQKIYDLNLFNYFDRTESGTDRNLCCKIGNKVFFAACNISTLVYMYNEDTGEGKYLENPSGLQYYGSIYAIDEKVYYFHRYQSSNVYVYSKDGELLQTIENEHGFIRYTEGTAFTTDGYKVNLSDFSFEPLSFPIEQGGDYYYIFKNGNIIKGNIAISSDNNQKGYLFSSYPNHEYGMAFNTNKYTIAYSSQGKLVFTYPYSITNSVNRQQFIDFVIGDGSASSVRKTSLYEKQVYMVDMYNHLIIEDVSLYVTD